MVDVGGQGCPCGGTYVKNTAELGKVKVEALKSKGKVTRVSYIRSSSAGGRRCRAGLGRVSHRFFSCWPVGTLPSEVAVPAAYYSLSVFMEWIYTRFTSLITGPTYFNSHAKLFATASPNSDSLSSAMDERLGHGPAARSSCA